MILSWDFRGLIILKLAEGHPISFLKTHLSMAHRDLECHNQVLEQNEKLARR